MFRWSKKDAAVTFPGLGKAAPLAITVVANTWRDETRVYSATVTANGRVIGVIDRAQWRNWRFLIKDSPSRDSDQLTVGFHSVG